MQDKVSSAKQSEDARSGSVVAGRYRLLELIGTGSMANVYRAQALQREEVVAIKVLHRSLTYLPDVVTRFEREAVAVSRIRHANVPQAYEVGKLDDGSLFMVLEYAPGEPLDGVIARESALPEPRALGITLQIAEALAASHALGIIHRDLKPENVMLVTAPDGREQVKVLDFGIAKVAGFSGAPVTVVGAVFGTPEYMSPEQTQGNPVTSQSDLYSLGMILYEMLAGKNPFAAPDPVTVLRRQMTEVLPPLPDRVSPNVRALVERLVRKDPAERPAGASEVVRQVEALLYPGGGRPVSEAPAESLAPAALAEREIPARRATKTHRFAAVAAVALLGVSGYGVWSGELPAGIRSLPAALRALPLPAFLRATSEPQPPTTVAAPAKPSPVVSVTPPATPPPAPPPVSPELNPKERKQIQAVAAKVIAEVERVPAYRRGPSDWKRLARAQAELGQHRDAVMAYSNLLSLTSDARSDRRLGDDLRAALKDPTAAGAALHLCSSPLLGARGLDLIFDAWRTIRRNPDSLELGARLWRELRKFRYNGSKALQVAIALEAATSCERISELLPEASRVGDQRALGRLREIEGRTRCAGQDCFSCLADSPALGDAIAKSAERAAPP